MFWDAWEFAQSIQGWATIKGVSRAVPMIAGKPTLVRAYLNASTPVEVRGELEAAPSASGPWRTIPCVNDPKLFIDGGSSLGSGPGQTLFVAWKLGPGRDSRRWVVE